MEPIKITEKAVAFIKEAFESKKVPEGYVLRVGAKGGGCSGVNTYLGFDKIKEDDKEFVIEGLQVVVQKKEMMFLIGKKLDYVEEGELKGFVFE
ncbi:iron-sulfur cluster assembly accessory protein [Persicobacter diffluens]|uniref:Core domain-containing protein n=1 Tax=Persicobacter diffluens TaxID=981 RepID=A0AAN5AI56_9BACT|nr:hypothetical protein PEDI_06070 [Persicobacter diffluens]